MQNHLINQTSPYLLQHAENPVDWYPWCDEAFEVAKKEDKPVFLSIGYSTCHWCHVMAHESFEDEQIAKLLNQYFVAVKVDKEERPDIDSIYMAVCQAFTGSGGWPTTIFLTPEQKPFFAGTYFPKRGGYGQIGLEELLMTVHEKWQTDRAALVQSADEVVAFLNRQTAAQGQADEVLIRAAVKLFKRSFDPEYGGFGQAPKFPTPHNLLFLLKYYEKNKDAEVLDMVEKTLLQMYRGGLFDHVGGGFCRYSTDACFLVPHFEKMLYDNALLILAYSKAYEITGKALYCAVAERTAEYVLREMVSPDGGFYSAQDADCEGEEGKYYLFEPEEITEILGELAGKEFCQYYDISEKGNFEGKNIPNLLKQQLLKKEVPDYAVEAHLQAVYEYRKERYQLHLDDKILTSWNGLMIAAMGNLYRVTGNERYLKAAMQAQAFIQERLCEQDTLYVSLRQGKRGEKGFLDDYAFEIFALLALYEATSDNGYLESARMFCKKVMETFHDEEQGGFFLYGRENEQLILRPKETYDGAIFSGNSAMAYNLVHLFLLTWDGEYEQLAKKQLDFMSGEAEKYPPGYSMFLLALSDYLNMPPRVCTGASCQPPEKRNGKVSCQPPEKQNGKVSCQPSERRNGKTSCQPSGRDILSEAITSGLGGRDNIMQVNCCATRLRCTVKEIPLVNDMALKDTGVYSVIYKGNEVQIVYGKNVSEIKNNLETYLKGVI